MEAHDFRAFIISEMLYTKAICTLLFFFSSSAMEAVISAIALSASTICSFSSSTPTFISSSSLEDCWRVCWGGKQRKSTTTYADTKYHEDKKQPHAISLEEKREGGGGERIEAKGWLSIVIYLSLNKLESDSKSGETLDLSHHLLVLEIRWAFILQPLQSGCDLLIKNLTGQLAIDYKRTFLEGVKLTTSISFSLLSFFSMVLWAEALLLSYILVPAASSIIDRI